MTLATAIKPRGRPSIPSPRLRLINNGKGGWTLIGAHRPALQFADFDVALDRARHDTDTQAPTIEVWQGGEYICCVPRDAGAPARSDSAFPRVERHANRIAQVLFAAAGPIFWLALLLLVVAASAGWRLWLL